MIHSTSTEAAPETAAPPTPAIRTPDVVVDPVAAFLSLSEQLTGFSSYELTGTGMTEAYLATVERHAGHAYLMGLLNVHASEQETGIPHPDAPSGTIHATVMSAITKLWYTGAWMALPEDVYAVLDALADGHLAPNMTYIPDREGYLRALVWKAFAGHPMGGKPPGFGSWAQPPATPTEGAR